jgi:hypothetical protein
VAPLLHQGRVARGDPGARTAAAGPEVRGYRICGLLGNDTINGAGNDTIGARNGKRETVDCGAGKRDRATADRRDKVRGCEKVERARR